MRALLQRAAEAHVDIGGETVGSIGRGLLILLGVCTGDTEKDCDLLADKAAALRIFEDDAGKMNLSVCDQGGEILVVSQFTLCADCRKGRRPSFTGAAAPAEANRLYERFQERLRLIPGVSKVESGRFGADMQVCLQNDGPVTILLDSEALTK